MVVVVQFRSERRELPVWRLRLAARCEAVAMPRRTRPSIKILGLSPYAT